MPHSTVSPEIKAAALADLAAGEQPAVVAQRYGLSRDMVNKWKQRTVSAVVSTEVSAPVSTQTAVIPVRYPTIEEHQQRIHNLMYKLLIAKLEASERLANHTTADWLDRQSATGLAELGDFFDRTAAGILALLVRRVEPDERAERGNS
jgi:hypothetical protein